MLLTNKKIAIIGAGPVGLTMATLLQQKGADVTVYERDKNAQTRISGGTLDLHKGSGQDALEQAGLLQKYYDLSKPMGRTVTDAQGNVLFAKRPGLSEQYDNPEINRNDLRKLLLDSLADGTVVWDSKLTGLEEHNGKWLLQFDNNQVAIADVVIGANGGMSKVRKYVTDAEIEYTGTLMLQGEVPEPEVNCSDFFQLCDTNILMASHESNLLVANPSNGNLLSYNVIFGKPEDSIFENASAVPDKETIAAFVADKYNSWQEPYQQLFRAKTNFVVWHTRKISLDIPWKSNRPLPITLIGDAAHIMPPFAGQGVNIGMKDAHILSDSLTNGKHATIEAAITAYEQEMFTYAAEAQQETSKNEIALFKPEFTFMKFYM